MVEAGRRLRASANSSQASSNATFLWPYLNQSRGSPLATIRSLRGDCPAGPLGDGRVASLCVPCHLGRVDELAGHGRAVASASTFWACVSSIIEGVPPQRV